MKILFDLISCGLGNGGGSSTIVKSANALKKLGHEVTIIDSMKNKHTWTKLECEHLIIKKESQIPDADIIIATGIKTVKHVDSLPKRCGLKLHWIRGHETWMIPENKIIEIYKKSRCIKIVNSLWLKDFMNKLGEKSYIVRPGNDFENFENLNVRNKSRIVLGGLHNFRHKKIKRMSWIFDTFEILRYEFSNLELHMFGNDNPSSSLITKYVKAPYINQKNKFFNHVDLWLAPTSQEGLHIVPQEAILCGCIVIGTTAKMAGLQDYLIHKKTGFVSENNFNNFVNVIRSVIINMQEVDIKKIQENAKKQIFKLGSRENNMKKFVDLMKELS